jgi:hypothetical protein
LAVRTRGGQTAPQHGFRPIKIARPLRAAAALIRRKPNRRDLERTSKYDDAPDPASGFVEQHFSVFTKREAAQSARRRKSTVTGHGFVASALAEKRENKTRRIEFLIVAGTDAALLPWAF